MSYSLLVGDALTVLRTLPANSVHCCVTSPPYYGLRDYGTATWEGGDTNCDHVERRMHLAGGSTLRNDGRPKPGMQETDKTHGQAVPYRSVCGKCGARRIDQQIGLEETPEAYVARLVEVFREVRRVLHPSGTFWCNIGDSYNGSGGAGGDYNDGGLKEGQPKYPGRNVNGLGPKQLLGIPWRLAFALQADGWILRSEIIWHKLAPMPESVSDRCTKAHEQVFLLAKSERYFFDAEAIKESGSGRAAQNRSYKYDGLVGHETKHGFLSVADVEWHNRNKRSVWTLGPESYSGSHYAVMPTKLVEPCVLAGTSAKGCCAKCLAPYERVVERNNPTGIIDDPLMPKSNGGNQDSRSLHRNGGGVYSTATTLGWAATCQCQADVIPCTVLDPFAGSGTTLAVALKFGRRAIGIDLDERNMKLVHDRIARMQPMLLDVTA